MDEVSLRWWKQSIADLNSARHSFGSKDYYVASFLSQQAVEKALKSIILSQKKELVRIHNLVVLGKMLQLPEEFLQKCDKLSVIYVETRYPDVDGELPANKFTKVMSEDDIKTAEEVLSWLKKKFLSN